MRTILVGVVSSFVALVGFASTANASVTVDLIWANSGTTATSSIATSSSVVLNIFLTNTEQNIGYSISVDYSDATGKYSVVTFSNTPAPFPFAFGATVDDGQIVNNFKGLDFLPGVGPGTYQAGTITFHKDGPSAGSFTVQSILGEFDTISGVAGAADDVICDFANPNPGSCTFNSATLNNVPEPGTVSLLALGLAGLALAGHRKN